MNTKNIVLGIIALMMALSVSLAFSSCGGGGDDDEPTTQNPGNQGSGSGDNGGGNSGGGNSGGGNSGGSSASEYNDYFSVDQATYVNGTIPGGNSVNSLERNSIVYYNERVLAGGMNFVTIGTTVEFTEFYIGIKGFRGYWRWHGTYSYREGDYYFYVILLRFSVYFKRGFTLVFGGLDYHDQPFKPFEKPISYEDSKVGDLNINLTFNNAKDIDLHLYTPSNKHIFYGQRRWRSDSGTEFGLDHDSNRGCMIDNLNNENIWIPSDCVENGQYRVVVDMYRNCDPNVSTTWSLVARYKGEIIRPSSGSNPASGFYHAGSGNGDMTTVMTFTINSATRSEGHNAVLAPLPPTEEDLMKLAESQE